MTASSDVTTGQQITAAQHNNLRADVINTSTGHRHDESDSRKLSTLDTATGHTHNGTDSRVAAVPYYNDKLTGDVTMTNANQYYSILTRSLAAGTWLVIGRATSAGAFQMRLSNSSTTYYAHAQQGSVNNSCSIQAVVVLGSTTTVAMQCAAVAGGGVIKAQNPNNGDSTNDATQLICIRIA